MRYSVRENRVGCHSQSTMDLSEFNPFVEIAEVRRIESGILHTAAFDTRGTAGGASGGVCKDLKIVPIVNLTGSENGIGNRIASFLAHPIL